MTSKIVKENDLVFHKEKLSSRVKEMEEWPKTSGLDQSSKW